MEFDPNIEIHRDGYLPARSGIGSSSAFTVGLLHALHALRGRMVSKRDLAMESIHIEQNIVRETVGSQDQISASYSGLNKIIFHQSGEVSVQPVIAPHERIQELNRHLMLLYTGIKRTAADIAGRYVHNIENHKRQLRLMNAFQYSRAIMAFLLLVSCCMRRGRLNAV